MGRRGESVWWVLAVGEPYDPQNFEQRETVRVRLRQELLLQAIVPDQYIWVWDETGRTQLVLRTFPDKVKAGIYAAYLSGRGVEVRVRRSFRDDRESS